MEASHKLVVTWTSDGGFPFSLSSLRPWGLEEMRRRVKRTLRERKTETHTERYAKEHVAKTREMNRNEWKR